MSHSLGQLADNFAAYAIYATAQSEMRHAYSLIDSGDYLAAAAELESAAHAARVLANASASLEPERAERWLRVAQARTRFATQARERAAEHAALAAYERAERVESVHYLADHERFADHARERAITRSLAAA